MSAWCGYHFLWFAALTNMFRHAPVVTSDLSPLSDVTKCRRNGMDVTVLSDCGNRAVCVGISSLVGAGFFKASRATGHINKFCGQRFVEA